MDTHDDPGDLDFESFVRESYPSVLAYLRWRTRDTELARDLAQETFLQAYRSRQSYRADRGDQETWVLGIARHVSAYAARRHQRKARELPAAEAIAEGAWADLPPKREETRRLAALRRCLETLTRRARDVLKRVYDEEFTYAHVAEQMGLTPSAVKVAAFRARKALLECIRRQLAAAGGQS